MPAARRAKIIATVGPATAAPERLDDLLQAGMDVARLNFSHGDHDDHARMIARLRAAAAVRSDHLALLADLQGPKLRVGTFPGGGIELEPDGRLTLCGTANAPPDAITVTYERLHLDLQPGDPILMDDGNLQLEVLEIREECVHCRVETGGLLKDRKGVNIPGRELRLPALTAKDRADLELALTQGVDWIALSFVQRPQDIEDVREVMRALGIHRPVLAKIEKPQALEHLAAIVAAADGLMVARGDLGVEIPAEDVPHWQKTIIRACNQAGKPVVTATQMLDSMIHNPRPTRAEASDVANAVLDGSDALMLSGETASGAHPIESVRTMARIIRRAEERLLSETLHRRSSNAVVSPVTATGQAACRAAELVGAAAIVPLTQTGSSARELARHRSHIPILAMTNDAATCRQLALVWGVHPRRTDALGDNLDEAIAQVMGFLESELGLASGDHVVFTAGLPFAERRATNTIRVETLP